MHRSPWYAPFFFWTPAARWGSTILVVMAIVGQWYFLMYAPLRVRYERCLQAQQELQRAQGTYVTLCAQKEALEKSCAELQAAAETVCSQDMTPRRFRAWCMHHAERNGVDIEKWYVDHEERKNNQTTTRVILETCAPYDALLAWWCAWQRDMPQSTQCTRWSLECRDEKTVCMNAECVLIVREIPTINRECV